MKKYVNQGGRCHLDNWLKSSRLTKKDRSLLEARIDVLEGQSEISPELVKKYKTTKFYEFKVRGDRKQLRPLCIKRPNKQIILLCGAIEKGSKIPKGDLERAKGLLAALEKGLGHVEDY